MITFDLKFNGKIRLSFDEIKELECKEEKIISKSYMQNLDKVFPKKIIIAEMFLPRGGRNIYGLLGIKYRPLQLRTLDISIDYNGSNKRIFNNALIQKIEPVFIGLPDEYFQYILDSVDSFYKSGKINFKGKINFCYAAYGNVSSNGWIFGKLTSILLSMLQLSKEDINSDMLMSYLAENIN